MGGTVEISAFGFACVIFTSIMIIISTVLRLIPDSKKEPVTITLPPNKRIFNVAEVNCLHSIIITRDAKPTDDAPTVYECIDGAEKVVLTIVEQ